MKILQEQRKEMQLLGDYRGWESIKEDLERHKGNVY